MLFLFKKKNCPPPPQKPRGYEQLRYGYMHKWLSLPAARDLDIY